MTRTERLERWLIAHIGRKGAFVVMLVIWVALWSALIIDGIALLALLGVIPVLLWSDMAEFWFWQCVGYGAGVLIIIIAILVDSSHAWDKWTERHPERKNKE